MASVLIVMSHKGTVIRGFACYRPHGRGSIENHVHGATNIFPASQQTMNGELVSVFTKCQPQNVQMITITRYLP